MRKWVVCSMVSALAVLAVWGVPGAQAQTVPPPNRDLTGVWNKKQAASPSWAPNTNRTFASEIPLQQWAQDHCREVGCGRGVNSAGQPVGDAYFQGKDPALIRCAPYGFPRIMIDADHFEIFQIPNRIFMRFYRNNEQRQIWMDGRGHPKDVELTWKGHSIGRWDGDTLVVDTVGILSGENGKVKWLDAAGHPHSDDLHVTERIRRVNQNTMQIDFVFEDPKTFTAPIRSRVIYGLLPNEEIVEYIQCEDRIFADKETEAWPFVTKDYDYKPQFPPAGTQR